jgi:hypothetical protein
MHTEFLDNIHAIVMFEVQDKVHCWDFLKTEIKPAGFTEC